MVASVQRPECDEVRGPDRRRGGLSFGRHLPGVGRPPGAALALATYVADPARRGEPTRFSVTRLPTLAVRLSRDGRRFDRWTAKGLSAIAVDTSVEDHAFVIEWRRVRPGRRRTQDVAAACSPPVHRRRDR